MADPQISISYVINNSEFNSKLGQMKKNMNLLNTEIRNSAKEVDLYGTNIQTLTKRQQAIQQAISQSEKIISQYSANIDKNKSALTENRAELERLVASKKEANTAYRNAVKMYGEESEEAQNLKVALEEVSSEYTAMNSKVQANEKAITNGTTQMERQRGTLLDLQNQLKATNEALEEQSNGFVQASKRFAEYGEKFQNVGGKIEDLGESVAKAGLAIVAAGAGLAKLAASAETGFAKVNTLARDSGESLEQYRNSVYELSNETGQSVENLTDGLYNAISA